MDIRTCSVHEDESKRKTYDKAMKWSTKFFDYVTIISELVAERLEINKYTILPLGANRIINVTEKKFCKDEINFLYVGTFENRNVNVLIKAYDEFYSRVKGQFKTKFNIVGFANSDKTKYAIASAMKEIENPNSIIFHGHKKHNEIIHLFEESSVGFSYIPTTDYYDVQPPTKTYEYILNGIVCIGTNTRANAQIINATNGVLSNEDMDSIVSSMETVSRDILNYNAKEVSRTVQEYEWDKIENQFYKFLSKINKKES